MTPHSPSASSAKIAALNDEFRQAGPLFSRMRFDGLWLITAGVQAQGPQFVWSALIGTQNFDRFIPDNDPYGEHDFGSLLIEHERVLWKIDYLERGTPWGAQDPTDSDRTCRMIMIMLAEEY